MGARRCRPTCLTRGRISSPAAALLRSRLPADITDLLGKVLVHGGASRRGSSRSRRTAALRILEAMRTGGMTTRNATMFGRAGWAVRVLHLRHALECANAVCGAEGEGVAVLLRGRRPCEGTAAMWAARPAAKREGRPPRPASEALPGVRDRRRLRRCRPRPWRPRRHHPRDDGVIAAGGPRSLDTGSVSPPAPRHPWRWFTPGDPHVSRPPRRSTPPCAAASPPLPSS